MVCCDLRFRLTHLGGKEGRVCVTCHATLINSGYLNRKHYLRHCIVCYPVYYPCVLCNIHLIACVCLTETLRKEQKKVWFADSVLSKNETSSANTTPTHRDSVQTHAPAAAHVVSADLSVSSFLQSVKTQQKTKQNNNNIVFIILNSHKIKTTCVILCNSSLCHHTC